MAIGKSHQKTSPESHFPASHSRFRRQIATSKRNQKSKRYLWRTASDCTGQWVASYSVMLEEIVVHLLR